MGDSSQDGCRRRNVDGLMHLFNVSLKSNLELHAFALEIPAAFMLHEHVYMVRVSRTT